MNSGQGCECVLLWSKVLLPPFVRSSWVESSPRLSETTALYRPSSALVTYQIRVCLCNIDWNNPNKPQNKQRPSQRNFSYRWNRAGFGKRGKSWDFLLPSQWIWLNWAEKKEKKGSICSKTFCERIGGVWFRACWVLGDQELSFCPQSLCETWKRLQFFSASQDVLNFEQPPTVKNILFLIRTLESHPGLGWKGP